jgi:prephenate dehydrogenase
MAGKAEQGFNNADCRIFSDANYILTPTEKNSEKNKVFVENIIKAIGFKNIIELSPEEHDKIVAYTSHLPHILAVSIINSKITDKDIGKLIGGSFKDATRVADINSELWCELLCDNSKYITSVIDEFEKQITLMKEAIITADKEALTQIFNMAKNSRRDIQ